MRSNPIAEFFWLSSAAASAKKLGDPDRARLLRSLLIGRQRAEAAEALWSNGHSAEGLRLAVQAFDATLDVVRPFGAALGHSTEDVRTTADPRARMDSEVQPTAEAASDDAASDDAASEEVEPADAPDDKAGVEEADEAVPGSPADVAAIRGILSSQGLAPKHISRIEEVRVAVEKLELPDWDDDISSAEGDLFQRLVSSRRRIDHLLAPALASTRSRAWTRFSRVGGVIGMILAVSIGSYLALRTPPGIVATASAQWTPDFGGPEGVIDGNLDTEWQLPNHTEEGWLQITIEPPIHMQTLRLLNGHNRQFMDRAVHEATIEVYADGERIHSFEQSWPEIVADPEWVEFEVNHDEVDKIRLLVRSVHFHGGAIAEVQWE